jgi:hypothetical protein
MLEKDSLNQSIRTGINECNPVHLDAVSNSAAFTPASLLSAAELPPSVAGIFHGRRCKLTPSPITGAVRLTASVDSTSPLLDEGT